MNLRIAIVLGVALVLAALVRAIVPSFTDQSRMMRYQLVPMHDSEVALLDTASGRIWLGKLTILHSEWYERTPGVIKKKR